MPIRVLGPKLENYVGKTNGAVKLAVVDVDGIAYLSLFIVIPCIISSIQYPY